MRYTELIIIYMTGFLISYGIAQTNLPLKRYCSSALNDALKSVCGGNFNSLGRHHPDSSYALYVEDSRYSESLFLSKLIGDGIGFEHHRVKRRGPIDECCHKPCTYTELKKYCAPSRT